MEYGSFRPGKFFLKVKIHLFVLEQSVGLLRWYEHLKNVHGLIICLRERAFSNGECPEEMQAYSFLVHF